MKKLLLSSFVLLLIASCSSTKTASTAASSKPVVTPAGEWDFSIKETPEGDFTGLMTVGQADKNFTAKLTTMGSDLPFERFTWDESNKKVGGELFYGGTSVTLDATLVEEEISGFMSTSGMSFPFKATRKK
jgi:hypothetical protein